MYNTQDIRNLFIEKYKNKEFVIDKTGVKLIELLGISYIVTEPVIFGTLNIDYANRELLWYKSMSLNVNDIPEGAPTIWKQVADKDGFINSNYGWAIWSQDNYNQYQCCLQELKNNQDTRRAIMIYTRPSMQIEYNKNGMSDFYCTNNVSCFIRKNKLIYIINQRSCDIIYGAKNDIFWHKHVHNCLLNDLKETYPYLEIGDMIHQVGSLHCYERHFKFLKENL